ncbi:MAG: hypothetical protein IKJ62_04730 [Alphaproteobacteria bacterium]|nr:hypothetical protein [Alphaproteobacteria bacterium]
MAFDSEKFLIDLAKQLNLKNMDDATRARLDDLKKKGVATKKQQGWDLTKPLPKIDDITPADPATGTPATYTYNGQTVAPTTKPKAVDLADIYKKVIVIMRDIHADKELRENDPTKKFLNTFYGAGKAVEQYTIAPLADAPGIANYISSNLGRFVDFFNGEIKERDFNTLITKLTDGSYISDTKSLKTLDKFLGRISYYYQWGSDKPLPSTNIPPCLGIEVTTPGGATAADLDTTSIKLIQKGLHTPVMPVSLDTFKTEMENLFGKLVSDDKLREKFSGKDEDGDITKWINKALIETDYKQGDHALAPKYTDRKTFWKRAKDKIKEWEVDTVGKLKNKHTRHIYSTDARFIVPELIDKGVKPTDGTGKILETLGAVIGNLPNPVQKKAKWVSGTMSKLSKTNFFKDALKDGDQMRQLVQEIIKAAAHDDKKEEAKVALEILAVMRYTMTTSSVRDKLKKTELSILSDPKLSWNKGLVANVTRAIDKTIHTGMMAAFEIGNLAKNALKENGVKFKQGTGRLDKRTTDSAEYTDPAKRAMMEELFAFWDFVNSSANTKDYNILASHKAVQEQADNPITGGTVSVMHDKFDQFYNSNSIGR